jgi:hypothetical protein
MSLLSDDLITVVTDEKTHFPLLKIEKIGFLTLWPITKVQYETFITQVNNYGDSWYNEILASNPRISFQHFSKRNYERLFITGLHIGEVQSFAKWFGDGYQIPTVKEWRNIYKIISEDDFFSCPSDISYPAKKIWKKFTRFSNSPSQFSLMKDGIIEWVRDGEKYAGLGAPRSHFYPNVLDPCKDLVTKIKQNERLYYFGFRLFKGMNDD